jgi:hypothetical protein
VQRTEVFVAKVRGLFKVHNGDTGLVKNLRVPK